jgi:hypothetical protein
MFLYHHMKMSASVVSGSQAKTNVPADARLSPELQNIGNGAYDGRVFDIGEIIKRSGGG